MGHENHDHEYMHAHNIEHTHEHEHDHEHPHCHGNCSECSGDPKAEAAAMLKYMVGHNAAHANELATLAKNIQKLGDNVAYEQLMAAVSDFEKGNMRLSAVLAAMNIPQ